MRVHVTKPDSNVVGLSYERALKLDYPVVAELVSWQQEGEGGEIWPVGVCVLPVGRIIFVHPSRLIIIK